MPVTVEIDINNVVNMFEAAPEEFYREIGVAMKESLTDIQRYARMNHEYITHTGKLDKSIQTDFVRVQEGGTVYLDTGIAVYGPPTHEGHGTWAPDRFLNRAAESQQENILDKITNAVSAVVQRLGIRRV